MPASSSSPRTVAAPGCECGNQEGPNEPHHIPRLHLRPQGKRLDAPGADMTQDQLDEHLHQTLMADRDGVEVSRVWLLADDATADALPPAIVAEAVRLILAGQGLLIAARRPEVEVDVREGLVRALDLFTAPPEMGERA